MLFLLLTYQHFSITFNKLKLDVFITELINSVTENEIQIKLLFFLTITLLYLVGIRL